MHTQILFYIIYQHFLRAQVSILGHCVYFENYWFGKNLLENSQPVLLVMSSVQ